MALKAAFKVGERVLCYHGDKIYRAKVLRSQRLPQPLLKPPPATPRAPCTNQSATAVDQPPVCARSAVGWSSERWRAGHG